jgi:hypothetical protein
MVKNWSEAKSDSGSWSGIECISKWCEEGCEIERDLKTDLEGINESHIS